MVHKLFKKLFKNKKEETLEDQREEKEGADVRETNKPKKNKSPSRIRRNWIRSQKYWEAKRTARDDQTSIQHSTNTNEDQLTSQKPPPDAQSNKASPNIQEPSPDIQPNKATPSIALVYENLEINMRLSRLEEASILTTALRHLVRTTHENGRKITFPVPEAVDRIQLKCANIPTDPVELRSLVDKVYKRRKEPIDMEELYCQFVITHGRIAYDSTQKWPMCHIHIRQP